MKVNEIITGVFINALKEGVIPWEKPWKNTASGPARNAVSGKAYRGVNALVCAIAGRGENMFLTFNQIKASGGMLKKGSKGLPICFYTLLEERNAPAGAKARKIPLLRYFTVFRLMDCEGLAEKFPRVEAEKGKKFTPVEAAENLAGKCSTPVTYGGNVACYVPFSHEIIMPEKTAFLSEPAFYATLFHEHGHGLHKASGDTMESHGADAYAREELVAEIFSGFCMAESGLFNDVKENSKAYIKGWMEKLANEPQMIISAASKAQKRFDSIIGASAENPGVEVFTE
jgi:antirestriction protein ArdC